MDDPTAALVVRCRVALRDCRAELNGLDDLAEQLRVAALELAARLRDRTATRELEAACSALQAWQIQATRGEHAKACTRALTATREALEAHEREQRAAAWAEQAADAQLVVPLLP